MSRNYKIAVLPGDGTGPEVVAEGLKVMRAAAEKFGFSFSETVFNWGGENYLATGEILPEDAVETLKQYDAVFADVPCSNSGVFRKRPDVLYRFDEKSLHEVVEIQKKILDNIASAVADNGFLLYSTCSIEPAEDGGQIRNFCLRHIEFELLEERLTLPDVMHDGSYCAVLRRNAK